MTSSDCTKCVADTKWLLNGVCHTPDCPVGYWKENNGGGITGVPICRPCSTIEARCTECHKSDGITCTKCVNGAPSNTGFLVNL